MKINKNGLGLFMIGALFLFSVNLYANDNLAEISTKALPSTPTEISSETNRPQTNHVVSDIDWVSEDSADVKIKWKEETKPPQDLMITGWQLEEKAENKETLNIYYKEAEVEGYDHRMVTIDEKKFPAKVQLIPADEKQQQQQDKVIFKDLTGILERDDAILNLYYQGILNGYPDGSFAPQKNVSRAEFAKILCEALKLKQSTDLKTNFTDINNSWAKAYIIALSEKGLVKGKSDTIFDPTGNITLGEVFALLDRSFYLYGDPAVDSSLPNHWSNKYYLSMKGKQVIKKTDDIYIVYPATRLATRADVALFLSRILEQKHDRR